MEASIQRIPERTCIGCGAKRSKNGLIRLSRNKKSIKIDIGKDQLGRGAYICACEACFNRAVKKKALERAFSVKLDRNEIKAMFKGFQRILDTGDLNNAKS